MAYSFYHPIGVNHPCCNDQERCNDDEKPQEYSPSLVVSCEDYGLCVECSEALIFHELLIFLLLVDLLAR